MTIPPKIKKAVTVKNVKTVANVGLMLATLFGLIKPTKATAIRDKVFAGVGLIEGEPK